VVFIRKSYKSDLAAAPPDAPSAGVPAAFLGGENMPGDDRIQQLIDAGVAASRSDFSKEAEKVIKALTDEEFNCLLSTRAKVFQQGGQSAQAQYDNILAVII
jgi:hypothetical protein